VPSPTPVAPTGLTAVPHGNNQVDLRWTRVTNQGSIDGIYIERSQNGSSFILINIISASATRLSDFQLRRNTLYWYRIQVHGPNGYSDYSSVVQVQTH